MISAEVFDLYWQAANEVRLARGLGWGVYPNGTPDGVEEGKGCWWKVYYGPNSSDTEFFHAELRSGKHLENILELVHVLGIVDSEWDAVAERAQREWEELQDWEPEEEGAP